MPIFEYVLANACQPSATAEAEAAKFRIGAYARLSNNRRVKRAIFEGPIFAGLIVLRISSTCYRGSYRCLVIIARWAAMGMPSCGWDDDLKLFELQGIWPQVGR